MFNRYTTECNITVIIKSLFGLGEQPFLHLFHSFSPPHLPHVTPSLACFTAVRSKDWLPRCEAAESAVGSCADTYLSEVNYRWCLYGSYTTFKAENWKQSLNVLNGNTIMWSPVKYQHHHQISSTLWWSISPTCRPHSSCSVSALVFQSVFSTCDATRSFCSFQRESAKSLKSLKSLKSWKSWLLLLQSQWLRTELLFGFERKNKEL